MTDTKTAPTESRAQTTAPAVDEAELSRRLGLLSLEQKVRLLTGADFWALYAEPVVGLRRLVVSDGPAGVRGELWDERDPSANVPSPTSLSASWDVEAVERLGALLAAEARAKGVDVLLAPDGQPAPDAVRRPALRVPERGPAPERADRRGVRARCPERRRRRDGEALRRQRLRDRAHVHSMRTSTSGCFASCTSLRSMSSFRGAGAWSVMAAYNRVNGAHMTENPLLREVLQDEWGFDGVTMSDWSRTAPPSRRGAVGST